MGTAYDLKALSEEALCAFIDLARLGDRPDLILKAMETLFSRNPSLADKGRVKDALDYGKRLLSETMRFEEAARIFLRVAREGLDRKDRLLGQIAAAEVYLNYLGNPDAAEALLLSIKSNTDSLPGRLLALRLGDIHLSRENMQGALSMYKLVENAPAKKKSRFEDSALFRGDFETTFRYYLNTGQLKTAEQALREWEISMPALKASGVIAHSWSELFMSRKQYKPALLLLKRTLFLDPQGNRVSSVLYDMALCHEMLGDQEKAQALYQRIIKEHPLSPERFMVEKKR